MITFQRDLPQKKDPLHIRDITPKNIRDFTIETWKISKESYFKKMISLDIVPPNQN